MNRHTKLAILILPFLLLGGYIASDFYLSYQAEQPRVFQLMPYGSCDVINQQCILKSGDFEVNVLDQQGITTVNSTFPLDSATLFLVDAKKQVSAFPLSMKTTPYYWHNETPLRRLINKPGAHYKLRLIANIKGGQYISEFNTKTMR